MLCQPVSFTMLSVGRFATPPPSPFSNFQPEFSSTSTRVAAASGNTAEEKAAEQTSASAHAPRLPLNQVVAHINAIIFDASADIAGALARHVTESCDGLRFPEINDEAMRMIRRSGAPLRVPVVRGLAVDGIFRRAILLLALFAVDIRNAPAVMADRLAGAIEHVEFTDGGVGLSVKRIERFDAEVTAFRRSIQVHFLQSRSGFKS